MRASLEGDAKRELGFPEGEWGRYAPFGTNPATGDPYHARDTFDIGALGYRTVSSSNTRSNTRSLCPRCSTRCSTMVCRRRYVSLMSAAPKGERLRELPALAVFEQARRPCGMA
jgi:hypothetical protein